MSGTGRRASVNPLIAGFVAGVLIALVVGVMATINLQYGAPWASTHTVTAQVSDADGISVGSDIRIAGRLVGQVVSAKAGGDHTSIIFHVDGGDWPLPADTTASVRLATLLGQKYLQLNPGHSSQVLPENAVLGVEKVRPVVDFDQILNTFDKKTRDSLTGLIQTVAGAVQGQEGTVQQLIPDLSDLSLHSVKATSELQTRNTEINSILTNLGITADQLNKSRDDFAGVIDNLNSVTRALSSNEGRALTSFISNTDTVNITTNAVLKSGYAAKLGDGLKQVGAFAGYLNTLMNDLIPQTASATRPAGGAEPSDFVSDHFSGGNQAIPIRSAIDLIYEISTAGSQGYATNQFGSGGISNLQTNTFIRQNSAGTFDPCDAYPIYNAFSSGGGGVTYTVNATDPSLIVLHDSALDTAVNAWPTGVWIGATLTVGGLPPVKVAGNTSNRLWWKANGQAPPPAGASYYVVDPVQPVQCVWGESGATATQPAIIVGTPIQPTAASASAPQAPQAPPAPQLQPAPLPAPAPHPGNPTPAPSPRWSPLPSPSWSPLPSPAAAATSYAPSSSQSAAADTAVLNFWSVIARTAVFNIAAPQFDLSFGFWDAVRYR